MTNHAVLQICTYLKETMKQKIKEKCLWCSRVICLLKQTHAEYQKKKKVSKYPLAIFESFSKRLDKNLSKHTKRVIVQFSANIPRALQTAGSQTKGRYIMEKKCFSQWIICFEFMTNISGSPFTKSTESYQVYLCPNSQNYLQRYPLQLLWFKSEEELGCHC